jgi:hypothetical protein
MNEAAAERLTAARAAELTKVLDLQSRWENLRAEGTRSTAHLHSLQGAFEAYRVCLAAYSSRDRSEPIPDLSPSGPARLGAWCRTVRAVLLRAGCTERPNHIAAKARRVAGQIAAALKVEAPTGEVTADAGGVIRELDAVIAWCRERAGPPEAGVFETGGPV